MAYTSDLYKRAEKILEKRRDKAIMLADSRSEKIRTQLPEIDKIQKQLADIGMEISKLYFFEGDVQEKVRQLRDKSNALVAQRSDILKQHGYAENAMAPEFVCAACNDSGFISGRLCNCHQQLLKELVRAEVSNFAPLGECTFDNFDLNYYSETPMDNSVVPRKRAEKIFEASMKYAQGFGKNSKSIVFLGSTGLGKTHLSLAIANVVINRGYYVCYGTSQNICQDLKNEIFGRDNDLFYTKDRVLGCDLLILDDLGAEIDDKYSVASVYNIVNSRILSGKPTVISTNFDWDELLERYGQRVTSRLNGEYIIMNFFGSDIRDMK